MWAASVLFQIKVNASGVMPDYLLLSLDVVPGFDSPIWEGFRIMILPTTFGAYHLVI